MFQGLEPDTFAGAGGGLVTHVSVHTHLCVPLGGAASGKGNWRTDGQKWEKGSFFKCIYFWTMRILLQTIRKLTIMFYLNLHHNSHYHLF